MPLMHKKSKAAFEHNIKAEMNAGKPQKQALAIAYDVKRRSKKASGGAVKSGSHDMDMAEGGSISASTEKRPMPDNTYDDAKMASQNRHMKSNGEDSWTDQPTVRQAQSNSGRKVMPIKRPKMVPTDAFSTRLYDEEGMLEESAKPASPDEKPETWHDEDGANRQGLEVRDMEDEHSTHRKPYAEGGEVSRKARINRRRDALSHKSNEELANFKGNEKETLDHRLELQRRHNVNKMNSAQDQEEYARGGMIDEMNHPSKHYMEHSGPEYNEPMQDDEPSEDEGRSMAMSRNEMSPDRPGPDNCDMEDQHNSGRKPYAQGGHIQFDEGEEYDRDEELNPAHDHYSEDDSEDQPREEADMDEEDSIAAAIMARKARPTRTHSDSDIDTMVAMAHGGEILEHEGADDILSHDSIYSDDSDQVDLTRNADEDANEEDQLSWNSLRKENYNTSYWDTHQPETNESSYDNEEMNSHDRYDMADEIRKKMKTKRQFKDR